MLLLMVRCSGDDDGQQYNCRVDSVERNWGHAIVKLSGVRADRPFKHVVDLSRDWRSDPITASELATSRAAVVKKQLDGAIRDITRRIDEQVYAPKQAERWAPGVDGKTLTFEGAPREHKS